MKNRLIRFACCLLLSACAQRVYAQTLFSYGPHKVSKAEFIDAFNRNNQVVTPTAKAYRDYLDLYTRYKLKVQAAYDGKFDTLPGQLKELGDFRAQVMDRYLSDDSTLDALTKEAVIRSREDRRISHIYLPYSGNDTAAAYAQARAALDALKKGMPFATAAANFSKDPAVPVNKADIGWISVFLLPYPLESLAYETPLQQYSQLYRGSDAYHIFYVSAVRPAKGYIQLQHLLLAVPAGSAPALAAKQQSKADSLYGLLQKGADFAELAHRFSDDNSTYQTNGIMNAFQPGTYETDFEEQAFSLLHDNDVSKPFRSSRGFHIIKRLTAYPAVTGDSNSIFAAMKTSVSADPRIRIATEMSFSKAKKWTGYTSYPVAAAVLDRYIGSFETGNATDRSALPATTVLAATSGARFTAAAFGNWLAQNLAALRRSVPGYSNAALLQRFLDQSLMQEYQMHLEKYNPEFAQQLKEFRDGNLIFEVMQQAVWDKAAADEPGLRKYYEAHRQQYRWDASFSGVLFNAADSSAARSYIAVVKNDPAQWATLLLPYGQSIFADSGRFETSQLNMTLPPGAAPGTVSEPVYNPENGNYQFVLVSQLHQPGEQRSYADARGAVLNDYQQLLEDQWIARLKKKYPVVVNNKVLQSILPK